MEKVPRNCRFLALVVVERVLTNCRDVFFSRPLPAVPFWKRLKGKNPEGKNFRKLLRRKQSSAKISKISRNTRKSSKSDIFYLLRNLLKYLPRTFFSSAKFSEVLALCVFTLWLFPTLLGVPKPGCFEPGCLQFSRGSALLRSFASFCALLRSSANFRLRSFALICVFLHPTAFRTTAFGNCRPFWFSPNTNRSVALAATTLGVQKLTRSGLNGVSERDV